MQLEGTVWKLKLTHLLYVPEAVLVGVVEVEDPALEFDPGSIPHLTLMVKPSFAPGKSRYILAAATAAGLLTNNPERSSHHIRQPGGCPAPPPILGALPRVRS